MIHQKFYELIQVPLSLFDLIINGLKNLHESPRLNSPSQRFIESNQEMACEIVEWRMNGYLRWGYELIIQNSARSGLSRQLVLGRLSNSQLATIVATLQRAVGSKIEIARITPQATVSATVRTNYLKLGTLKAEVEWTLMSEGSKKTLSRKLLDLLNQIKSSL